MVHKFSPYFRSLYAFARGIYLAYNEIQGLIAKGHLSPMFLRRVPLACVYDKKSKMVMGYNYIERLFAISYIRRGRSELLRVLYERLYEAI